MHYSSELLPRPILLGNEPDGAQMDAFTGEGTKLTSSLMCLSTLVAKARVEGELDLVETSVAKGLTSNRGSHHEFPF